MKVSVSFLSSKNIPRDLRLLNDTDVDYIHVDVMDGKFVENKTMPFENSIILENLELKTNKTNDCTIKVTFKNIGVDQSYNNNKSFRGTYKIIIKE